MKINRVLLSTFLATCPDQDRCTGRSTGQALQAIGVCLQNPGQKYKLRDHHGTLQADRHLLDMVSQLVHELDLKYFTFYVSDNEVEYNPFVEVKGL